MWGLIRSGSNMSHLSHCSPGPHLVLVFRLEWCSLQSVLTHDTSHHLHLALTTGAPGGQCLSGVSCITKYKSCSHAAQCSYINHRNKNYKHSRILIWSIKISLQKVTSCLSDFLSDSCHYNYWLIAHTNIYSLVFDYLNIFNWELSFSVILITSILIVKYV